MNKNKTLFIIALVFVLLLGGAYVLYGKLAQGTAPDQLSVQGGMDGQTTQPSEELQKDTDSSGDESTEPEKVLVPDFAVYDSEGNEVHLSDFIGKPIVLNFWASWCGPCKMLSPLVEEIGAQYEGKALIAKVNVDEEPELARQFGVMSIPTVVFLKNGREFDRKVGVMPPQAFTDVLDKNL